MISDLFSDSLAQTKSRKLSHQALQSRQLQANCFSLQSLRKLSSPHRMYSLLTLSHGHGSSWASGDLQAAPGWSQQWHALHPCHSWVMVRDCHCVAKRGSQSCGATPSIMLGQHADLHTQPVCPTCPVETLGFPAPKAATEGFTGRPHSSLRGCCTLLLTGPLHSPHLGICPLLVCKEKVHFQIKESYLLRQQNQGEP